MMSEFQQMLTGGHPNSLGKTEEVVAIVLKNPDRFDELFQCYFCDDEIVRLRTSSAIKRICKADRLMVLPYFNDLVKKVAAIDQASTQWTIAILFDLLHDLLSEKQSNEALTIMKKNLQFHHDWIVLNTTMEVLAGWTKSNQSLKRWLIPHLERLSKDVRKSVSGKAKKCLNRIGESTGGQTT